MHTPARVYHTKHFYPETFFCNYKTSPQKIGINRVKMYSYPISQKDIGAE